MIIVLHLVTLSATYRSAQAVNKPLITKEIACHVHIAIVHKNTFLKQNKLYLSKKKQTKTKRPMSVQQQQKIK